MNLSVPKLLWAGIVSNSVKRIESLRPLGESVVQFKESREIEVLKEGVTEKLETFP